MIHWLIQSLDDCPEILHGDVTPAWLGAAERTRTFKAEKRRRDWLLGRWTAKNLVQRYLAQTTGETPALESIFIGADADGAPFASCEGRGARGDERLPVSLSISHSHGTAFCGLVEIWGSGDYAMERLEIGDRASQRNLQSPISNLSVSQSLSLLRPSLGCDLELIEPREGNFLDNFFTAAEMAAVREVRERMGREAHRMNSAPATESALQRTGAVDSNGFSRFPVSDDDFNRRGVAEPAALAPDDILTTAIWSGKEAVLKALREGLRIDTRRITCQFAAFETPPQEWTPFVVDVDEGLADQFPGEWSGWWKLAGRFALTIALLQHPEHTTETQ